MPASPPSAGGGVLIALGALLGTGLGLGLGQVTIGFLIGIAIGTVAALGLWWRTR